MGRPSEPLDLFLYDLENQIKVTHFSSSQKGVELGYVLLLNTIRNSYMEKAPLALTLLDIVRPSWKSLMFQA